MTGHSARRTPATLGQASRQSATVYLSRFLDPTSILGAAGGRWPDLTHELTAQLGPTLRDDFEEGFLSLELGDLANVGEARATGQAVDDEEQGAAAVLEKEALAMNLADAG